VTMRGLGPATLAQEHQKRSRPLYVLLAKMIRYLGRFRRRIAVAAILVIFATVFTVLDPVVLSWGIDFVLTPGGTLTGLLTLALMYFALRFGGWLFNSLYTWILASAQAGFVQSIQQDTYDHLVHADLAYHKSEQSGNVTSRVTSDTDSLSDGIQIVIEFASQLLLVVATFILLWETSPFVAFTSLVVLPVVILIVVLFGTVGQRTSLAWTRATGDVSGQIAEDLSGIHIAKAFNREKELAANLGKLNQEVYHWGIRFTMLMTLMQPLVRATGIFALAAILFVGGSLAVGTAPLLSLGEVFLGTILIQRFIQPLVSLSQMATQFQSSMASMDRILDVLEAPPTIRNTRVAKPLKDSSDGITFDKVSFAYVKGIQVLKHVSFVIHPGETVAIVGHTGAGKTTIASLINRFYDPQEGHIRIGDQDLKQVTLESLHEHVALIAQEPYLFDDTVLENLRYGRHSATDQEIIELCRLIGAHEFIEVLPHGYQSMVTEGGRNLSAGQVQIIAIARTMLANPRILILDEATSRLDAYSESLVQAAQQKLFAGRTTVVIAHRLTTIAGASRVLVFDHGELVEQGTHEELLALGGRYKALYDTYYAHQSLEELSEETVRVAQKELARLPGQSATAAAPQKPEARATASKRNPDWRSSRDDHARSRPRRS
jgi:ATP-binding cassette subfamily B multidrug efflux pump